MTIAEQTVEERTKVFLKHIFDYSDCQTVLDRCKEGAICFFVFTDENDTDAQNLLNYLAGGLHALGGIIESYGDRTFMARAEMVN